MSVTLSQARYIITMYQMKEKERNVTKIASVLGVSKPSVTNMMNLFIERGIVKKGRNAVPTLTSQGKTMVEGILKKHEVLTAYFTRELGLPLDKAKQDALVFIYELSEEAVESFLRKIELAAARAMLNPLVPNRYLSSFQGVLEDGVYDMDFTLFRKGERGVSMGDKGLLHPVKLVVADGKGILSLRAVPISHRAILGDVLRGRLSKLYFWNGKEFVEVHEVDGAYSFPVMDMRWSRDKKRDMDCGMVEIKVQASVGILNMPESVANLAIYFDE